MMKKCGLVIIPSPGKGHLVSTIEFAKHLLRHHVLSITIIVIPPFSAAATVDDEDDVRIQYIHIPRVDLPFEPELLRSAPEKFVSSYIEGHKNHVTDAISNLVSSSVQLVGVVVDMFCTSMIDVSNQFDLPSYLFFTSSAAFLGLIYYLPTRYDQVGVHFRESDSTESIIPSYVNPVPATSLPSFALNKEGFEVFMSHAKRFKETKGIFVNTFAELESHAVQSLLTDGENVSPPVYTVGPLLDLSSLLKKSKETVEDKDDKIMKWLDNQPPSSVVLLCFGSYGSFDEPSQLTEIALGLERSGHRFLWSVRQSPTKEKFEEKFEGPSDYTSYEEILPPGFLERVGERGMTCGWAPQVKILAHRAIGGFVSHCGWNSILESLWFGVPIAAWPLYAEQQINAFQMVRDLGLAIEVKLDYRKGGGGGGDIVTADDIERAVTYLMDGDSQVRKRVKEIGEKSRKAVADGGSSFVSFERLKTIMFGNMS